MPEPRSQILIYQPEGGKTRIDVRLENETVWLTQGQLVDLFQSIKQNICLNIRNLFTENELDETSVVKQYLTTATANDGDVPKLRSLRTMGETESPQT